ncbi:MAG: NAD-dependent epimerase/dehydratase family protein [Deltaproteobacteria bacterium]|nr:NAD-dependent epimerase/dehydratase family protein [Deltaproteobacteria bacterium]
MNIAVTGGYGFIGQAVVRDLAAMGHAVTVLGRSAERFNSAALPDAVSFRHADLADPTSLRVALESVDVVIHLAGRLGGFRVTSEGLFAVNETGTKNVLAAARHHRIHRFVHASTPGVCGFSGCLVDEAAPYRPRGAYEASKVAAERLVLQAADDMEVVVLRPDFVYGPGDIRRLSLFRAILKGHFFIPGDGKACWRPTYVDDVARAFTIAVDHPKAAGEIFNIAGPNPVTVAEFADQASKALRARRVLRHVPVAPVRLAALASEFLFDRMLGRCPPLTRSQVEFLTMDHGTATGKAADRLGFVAQVELEDGLARTVDWYEQHGLLKRTSG